MIVNLNNTCSVFLSKHGAKHLNSINKEVNRQLLNRTDWVMKQDYKQGDIYEDQLWHIMEVFGFVLGLGKEVPFIDNEMIIVEE